MKPLLFFHILFVLLSCGQSPVREQEKNEYTTVEGETMGTYYRVSYSDTTDFKQEIEQLLQDFNMEVSTYIPESKISAFNQSASGMDFEEGVFTDNLRIAREVYDQTKGLYDVTVMPLVNYWGFGYTEKKPVNKVDSAKIKALLNTVGMDKLHIEKKGKTWKITKSTPGVQLDFSSVAKGYGVDLVAKLLEQKGIRHYLVDIGGEMVMKGKNPKGKKWSIGINVPEVDAGVTESIVYLALGNNAIATSGNYRNFYEVNGARYAHTINPVTGFPESSKLLSATIIAPDCATADAWATACMVSGLERSAEYFKNNPQLSACLIYADGEKLSITYHNDFEKYIQPAD
ncbi:MAG TPA: FAD:protein FMN transferase [Saprospirales bacterium]|nr:FAD:protein FMN transferase [Saprospirales bacterium]HAY71993.1 FAD:protein FMN transferase [Saprospirales bacterium]HRQ30686.1 FAD:protein FMN transferase [Saprospiraceae bacterium]